MPQITLIREHYLESIRGVEAMADERRQKMHDVLEMDDGIELTQVWSPATVAFGFPRRPVVHRAPWGERCCCGGQCLMFFGDAEWYVHMNVFPPPPFFPLFVFVSRHPTWTRWRRLQPSARCSRSIVTYVYS